MFVLLRPDGVHVRVIVQGQYESLQKQSSRDYEPHEPVPKRARLLVRTDEKEQHSWYDHEDETLEERRDDPRVFRFVRFLLEKREYTFWMRENALVSFRVYVAVEDDSRSVVVGADIRESSTLTLVVVVRRVRGRRSGRPHR